MPDFSRRSEQEEWMDDLSCSGEVVIQTLKELDFINRTLGGNYISLNGLKALTKGHEDEAISLVDLGCGGGDILKLMAKWARKKKIQLNLTGVDANPAIIAYAQSNCQDFPEINFLTENILEEDFQSRQFDIFHSSLFTHHFSQDILTQLFSKCYQNSRLGVINNDLHRHWFAYYSIKSLTSILSRSPMVQNDACLSVLRGFHKKELSTILDGADIHQYDLAWKWAFRWQLIIPKRS